jgi:hypothetical protein
VLLCWIRKWQGFRPRHFLIRSTRGKGDDSRK